MRRKLLFGMMASLFLMFAVANAQSQESRKVSPAIGQDQMLPLPPIFDNENIQPLVIGNGSDGRAGVALAEPRVVPEASTVSMVFLGLSILGGVAGFRRLRKA